MSHIRRVLLPIDLSSSASTLASTVQRMIECWGVDITLLHVLESRPLFGRGNEMERAMAQLEFTAATDFGAARVTRRVDRGGAADRILDYVRENHVDLIVMAASGASGIRRRPLGHVAEAVLAEAPCSVWLDWPSTFPPAPAGMSAERVCCAIDLDGSGEHVVRSAARFAGEIGAGLTIVHAVQPEQGSPALQWDTAVRERAVRMARMQVDALRRRLAPGAEVTIEVGATETVVSRAIQDQEAGLLVSAGARKTVLAAESACPVLRIAVPQWSVLSAPGPEVWTAAAKGKCA